MDLCAGARVGGSYQVERKIASGGIGEVWSGIHVGSQKRVALKRLLPLAVGNLELVLRFDHEGEVLGRIQSEFVARKVDFVTDPRWGRILVQDFVEGESLSDLLKRRTLTVEETREIGFHLLRGLCALERAHVVHCDLKPGNIILRPLGGGKLRPMLIDFGAARLLEGARGRGNPHLNEDRAIGTIEYMAPEQVLSGQSITPAADLYAVGAILYRAISGEGVFGELAGVEIVRAKSSREAPALITGRSDWVARQLESVVGRALQRDLAARYKHAEDMLTDLLALPRGDQEKEPKERLPVAKAARKSAAPPPIPGALPTRRASALPPPPPASTLAAAVAPAPAKRPSRGLRLSGITAGAMLLAQTLARFGKG